MAANDKTIRLTHPIGARGVSGLEAATQGATVEVAIGSFRGPREALRSPRRLALLSRVPAASLPGAQTPAVVAPPRRPVAPPVTGPLALVVVDSEEAGWPFQNVLHSLGLRTLVRQGGLEALHAVTDYPPALVLLAAWRGPVDSRVFARTCQTLAPHLLECSIGVRQEGGDVEAALLRDEGISRFAGLATLQQDLCFHLHQLGVQPTSTPPGALDRALAGVERPKWLLPGESIASRFVVEDRIGSGATATVYRVRDELLGGRVAMKLLEQSADPYAGNRFRREMQIARELLHPNLVRCFDFGRHGQRLFYTMELLQGPTLRNLIDGRQIPRLPVAFDMLTRLMDAVGTLHSAGVLHRDIKPGNVFLDGSGGVRLGDFGASRRRDESLDISATGFLIGTPGYLPPERLLDDAPDSFAGDVFAFGVLAFELLSGRKPWPFHDLPGLLAGLERGAAPRASLYALGIPPEADRVLGAMLERDPGDRPSDCFALSRAFRRCSLLLA